MPRGIPNAKLTVEDYILQTNKDGLSVINLFPGVVRFHETGSRELLLDSIKIAFKHQLLVNVSEYMMPEGFYDINQTLLFIDEMGFTKRRIAYDMDRFSPWFHDDLYFLESWEPGINVSPFAYWSEFGKNAEDDNIEGLAFNRFTKYAPWKMDIDAEVQFDQLYDIAEDKNWRKNRDENGLYSIEEGRKFKYEEKHGWMFGDRLMPWKPCKISVAPADDDKLEENIHEDVPQHRGRRRRCLSCGSLFYRDELEGGICKECKMKK